MAFVKVNKGMRGVGAYGGSTIRMALHPQSEKAKRGLYFSIGYDIINQVGWPIEEKNEARRSTTVGLLEGTGKDGGSLLLVYDDKNGYSIGTTKEQATSFTFSVSWVKIKHYKPNGQSPNAPLEFPTTEVEYIVDEKEQTILIQCPEWLVYDPTTYTEPEEERKPARPPLELVPPKGKERRHAGGRR